MIPLLLALAALGASPTAAPRPAASAAASPVLQELPDLGDEVDAAIRWLRSAQDPIAGCYGDSVDETSWALLALARSPRAYGVSDGPFVRKAVEFLGRRQAEDGSIADEGAGDGARVASTRLAAAALSALPPHEAVQPILAPALAYLEPHGLSGPGWDEPAAQPTPEEAEGAALRRLARRDDATKAWSGERGDVIETAAAVIELSRLRSVLRAAAPREEARPARRLPPFDPAQRDEVLAGLERGARFLVGAGEAGRWGGPGEPDPGITAMVLGGLLELPEPRPEAVQEAIDAGLAWLVSLQREDGSIHAGRLANYTTSAAVLALAAAGREQDAPRIARARAFLQDLQADAGEGYSEGDLHYGGIGYGGDERPDLSNLRMALEALSAAGLEQGDPTFQKALAFLERCQNRSESSDVDVEIGGHRVQAGDDGGGVYMPADSKAGFAELADGTRVPRSYGSMTYALLKCYVLAGLSRDDPRLQAAWEWCQRNYTLDVNPGFEASDDPRAAYQGLYYYFLTMARALDAYGTDVVVDAAGEEHAWRHELCGRLLAMQASDGSWVNENSPRWWEGNPVLATAYALLTLGEALPAGEGGATEAGSER